MKKQGNINQAKEAQEHRTQYEKRREYFKEYRRKNPERVKRWRENYILTRAERIKAKRQENPTGGQEGPQGAK